MTEKRPAYGKKIKTRKPLRERSEIPERMVPGELRCEKCGKTFSSTDEIDRHNKTVHGI
jgi:lysyl-tRNA synthetase class I